MANNIFGNKWLNKLMPKRKHQSFLRSIISGSLYRISDLRGNTSLSDIQTQIDTMRALARDSQIATALSYYATDATTTNTGGQIIWATADSKYDKVAEIINDLFKRWNINAYARDHILELATIGNLYLPTTIMYNQSGSNISRKKIALDNNTIPDINFDIIPSTKIAPESIVHLWKDGQPCGYLLDPDEDTRSSDYNIYPESACIHFTLGGLLGDYTLDTLDNDGNKITYDIQFAQPLMDKAVQPTQTLSLLEDANVLASLTRIVKFINVECNNAEEDEIESSLQMIKDAIEQQLSINTNTGDAQSFVNPQSPNNLIYLPKINGQDAISITDLNMAESTDQDNKLLDYYQNKKLSVLGIPKEAMNYSSNEGLGGAGSVLSQRSTLYANSLQRLETAYIAGWTDALNKYFISHNMSGFVDNYQLHMNPIITQQSTVQFDKRDSALNQATSLISILKDLNIKDNDHYTKGLAEILSEVLPQTGSDVSSWDIDATDGGNNNEI